MNGAFCHAPLSPNGVGAGPIRHPMEVSGAELKGHAQDASTA